MKNKITALIASIAVSFALNAQNVDIPDSKFKSLLLSNSNINTNGDDEISIEEAQAFDGKIDVKYEDISDLTGIEAFTSITELYCGFNNLTSLDVTKNTELRILSFFFNDIGTIDLSKNIHLTAINCREANLTSIDLSKNLSLSEYYGEGNSLTSLDVSNNTELTILDCGKNQITSLDLSNNTNLIEVHCDDNLISEIDITLNTELTQFNCFRNNLTSLNVENNTELMDLSCSDNKITSLDVSANTNLIYFGCYNNLLNSLDVSQNPELKLLFCDNNNITTLDFSQNTKLTKLDIYSNNLFNLNLQNGNNNMMEFMNAWNNPNLSCIQVDDVAWSSENWTNIDDASSFDTNCPILSDTEEADLISFQIYPNPAFDFISIETDLDIDRFVIYNFNGQKVLEEKLIDSRLDIRRLDAGFYILHPESSQGLKPIKFVKY